MKIKSGKQKRLEIKAKRKQKGAQILARAKPPEPQLRPVLGPPVNEALLAPYNSYGVPDFVARGFYVDMPFQCKDCGKDELWTGTQQKWWHEVAKGSVYSGPLRCRACRRREQARRDEARRVHLDGLQRKAQRKREGSK